MAANNVLSVFIVIKGRLFSRPSSHIPESIISGEEL